MKGEKEEKNKKFQRPSLAVGPVTAGNATLVVSKHVKV
jgi:hypothetical protein